MTAFAPIARAVNGGQISAWLQSYLFRPGGAYSIAICRIALFVYLYIHVVGDAVSLMGSGESYLSRMNIPAYYPKSIVWLLFPTAPPPGWVIDLVLRTAQISTLLAVAGLLTRASMIVATLSCLFLGALIFSWEPLWSHPYNSGLIAGLAFMFGRAGDTLSIDSLIARFVLRRPIGLNRDVYWWPVILGQFGVAAVYFGGFYAKWSTPDFTYDLAWVFSDNLRNSVVLPWLIRGQQLPWNVDLIVNNPWLWKLAAFGHLATQALPMLALLSLNRPWLRLLEGGVFAAGVVLLKLIMGMWNPSWIILTAFFVDWEFFFKKLGVKFSYPKLIQVRSDKYSSIVVYYCLAMFLINIIVILIRYDDRGRSRLYPFSSMGFYSSVMALKPYSEHRHYPFPYGQIEFVQADSSSRYWHCAPGIAASYLATFATADDAEARAETQAAALRSLLAGAKRAGDRLFDCEGVVQTGSAVAVNLYSSILQIAPHPEPAQFEVGHRALVSRFEKDKERIIAASSQAVWAGDTAVFNVASRGFGPVRYEILFAEDPWKKRDLGPLTPVPGVWNGRSFKVDADFYDKLPSSAYPIVVRAIEPDGATYDFFGGILYK